MGEVEDKIIKNDDMYEDFKHSNLSSQLEKRRQLMRTLIVRMKAMKKGQGPTEQQLKPYMYINQ